MFTSLRTPPVLLFLTYPIKFVFAACECGYSVNSTTGPQFEVFTDLLETDFLHLTDFKVDVGWRPLLAQTTGNPAAGQHPRMLTPANVVPNPLKDPYSWAGAAVNASDPGLQLWVHPNPYGNGTIGTAEIDSERNDIMYGSFRIAMKVTNLSGTCSSFFWYRNNSQEIDVEILSRQLAGDQGQVNFVVQTPESAAHDYNAFATANAALQNVTFDPSDGYHEYRFDWFKDRVSYYIDGQWMKDMTEFIPSEPGPLIINHWSDGSKGWTYGPPVSDAVMTVSYAKAYFNTTTQSRLDQYNAACSGPDAISKVCQIPDQTVAPTPLGPNGNQTAHTYFFTLDKGHTPNQTTYNYTVNGTRVGSDARKAVASGAILWAAMTGSLLAALWIVIL